jgi:hypothetical protein
VGESLRQFLLKELGEGVLPSDESAKISRHVLRALKPKLLRKFLVKPIKAYKVADMSDADKQREIGRMTEERINALFALYGVPDILPEDEQWRWLAMALAGELFHGCKTLSRGRGGATRKTLQLRAERKEALSRDFDAYRAKHLTLSRADCARHFLKLNSERCQEDGYTDPRSLLKGLRAIRKN